jgi:hypothetical protein
MNAPAAAAAQYTAVLAVQPGHPAALLRRGLARAALRDYGGAAADIEAARALGHAAATAVDYRTIR